MYNKKGSMELSIVIFGLIFMAILNISLGFILDSTLVEDYVEEYDTQTTVNEYVNEELDLGLVTGAFVTAILWVLDLFFSLFGVNFIGAITVLPLWVLTIFGLFNSLIAFSIIMYFVDRLWFG